MYCVIGEKILRCEISEKTENFSWVIIGKSDKKQTIPNNRIFETHEQGEAYIKRKAQTKTALDKQVIDQVYECKRLYAEFEKETGISVRVIDRCFKPKEVKKQLDHLRKKYSKSEAGQKGERVEKDSRSFSKKSSSSYRDKDGMPKKPNRQQAFGNFDKKKK